MIDAGKQQWALANHKTNGDAVVVSGVNEYIKGNTTPVCPAGGQYTYNPIGSLPVCSLADQKPIRRVKQRISMFRWQWDRSDAGLHKLK